MRVVLVLVCSRVSYRQCLFRLFLCPFLSRIFRPKILKSEKKGDTRCFLFPRRFKRKYFVHSSCILCGAVRSRLIRELSYSLTLLLSGFREKKELAGGRHPSPPPQIRTFKRRRNRAFSAFHAPTLKFERVKTKRKRDEEHEVCESVGLLRPTHAR